MSLPDWLGLKCSILIGRKIFFSLNVLDSQFQNLKFQKKIQFLRFDFTEPIFTMRLTTEDNPEVIRFLKRFELERRDSAGRLMFPDLIEFFDQHFTKNADNHQYIVSLFMFSDEILNSFKVVPLMLEVLSYFFQEPSVQTSLNEYIYSFGVKPWSYDSTKVVLK